MLTRAFVPWRVILATVIAALLIAALPQAAETATKRQRCIAAAEKALGQDIRASDYRIVLGTDKPDEVLWPKGHRKDLICGFGGREEIPRGALIRPGDIFISGKGGSHVWSLDGGVVIGGSGQDNVHIMSGGRFEGRGNQDFVVGLEGGVFFGGDGADAVIWVHGGARFIAGRGADYVENVDGGVFRGKRGADCVQEMVGGTFYGGNGPDSVMNYHAGRLISVESRTAEWCLGLDRLLGTSRLD